MKNCVIFLELLDQDNDASFQGRIKNIYKSLFNSRVMRKAKKLVQSHDQTTIITRRDYPIPPELREKSTWITWHSLKRSKLYSTLQENSVRAACAWYKCDPAIHQEFEWNALSLLESVEQEISTNTRDLIEIADTLSQFKYDDIETIYSTSETAFLGIPSLIAGKLSKPIKFLSQPPAKKSPLLSQSQQTNETSNVVFPSTDKDVVLFLPLVENGLEYTIPIASKLPQHQQAVFMIYRSWSIIHKKKLEEANFPCIFYDDILSPEDNLTASTLLQNLKQELEDKFSKLREAIISSANERSPVPLGDHIFSLWKKTLNDRLSAIITNYQIYNKIYNTLKPKMVISSQEKILRGYIPIALAKAHNSSTMIIHTGILEENPLISHLKPRIEKKKSQEKVIPSILADVWVVMEKRLASLLKEAGIQSERLVYVGLWKTISTMEEIAKSVTPNTSASKTILYTTQAPSDQDASTVIDRIALVEAVCRAAEEFPGSSLVIKPHPKDPTAPQVNFPKILKKYPTVNARLAPREEGIADYLRKADVVISAYSSILVDSMYCKKPAISALFTGRPDPMGFTKATIDAYNNAELISAVHKCLEDKKTQSLFLKRSNLFLKNFLPNHKDPVEKIVQAIRAHTPLPAEPLNAEETEVLSWPEAKAKPAQPEST